MPIVCKTVIYIVAFLIAGSSLTLILKWQDRSTFLGMHYSHPILQSIYIYIGMIPSYIVYAIQYRRMPSSPFKKKALFLIVGGLDIVNNIMMSFALLFVAASVYQMARASVLAFVVLFSWLILKKIPNRWNSIGVGILITAITVIGLSQILFPTKNESSSLLSIGLVLVILAQLLISLFSVLEEKLLSDMQIHPTEAVALEGISGFVFASAIALPIFCNIKCAISDWCPTGVMEDVVLGMRQIFSSFECAAQVILLIVVVLVFNIAAMTLMKEVGATTRTVLDCGRMMIIWVVGLSLRWEAFNWLQLIGFVGIVVGILMYNGIFALIKCRKTEQYMNIPTVEREKLEK